MRALLVVLLLLPLGEGAPGQVVDGDFLITLTGGNSGIVIKIDRSTGIMTTILHSIPGWIPLGLRMAPDNRRLIVGYGSTYPVLSYVLMSCTPGSTFVPVVCVTNRILGEFQLDHDDSWIITSSSGNGSALLEFDETSNCLTTLFQQPSTVEFLDRLCIDRDPGALPYAITTYPALPWSSSVLLADRQGVHTTVHRGTQWISDIDFEPATGDYILTSVKNPPCLLRMKKTGALTSLPTAVLNPRTLQFDFDGNFWISGGFQNRPVLAKLDGSGRMLGTVPLTGLPSGYGPSCLEVYGRRRLVCSGSGKPGTTVSIRLQSRCPGDGNQPYTIACSFARRPGMRLPNGEHLDLSVIDPLFLVTATNSMPAVFQNFQGNTDSSGNAMAKVVLPRGFPAGLGITVFVAGIILDNMKVRTVTNTHWFLLK